MFFCEIINTDYISKLIFIFLTLNVAITTHVYKHIIIQIRKLFILFNQDRVRFFIIKSVTLKKLIQ